MKVIEGLGPRRRYGYQIIKLPHGTWFWDPMFEGVEFVPKGKMTSTDQRSFRYERQNTLAGALILAMKAERDRILKETP